MLNKSKSSKNNSQQKEFANLLNPNLLNLLIPNLLNLLNPNCPLRGSQKIVIQV